MEHEETRKGPWTEHEDLQLAYFVHLFGERRWDFIAKVSGLNRSGKSCRLRWVNYLHPGLKRGRMTLQEERIILELHSKWGNRWSRIARKLPGRTDNEIKNYWRTHTRKKAQQMKLRPGSSSSNLKLPRNTISKLDLQEKLDSGGEVVREEEDADGCYNMDQIWKEIDSSPSSSEEIVNSFSCLTMASPLWISSYSEELCCSEEDIMMLLPTTTHFDSYFENGRD